MIQSAVTILAYVKRMSRRRIDLPDLVEYWSDRVEHLMRACLQLPANQSIDVPFNAFMADGMGMVEQIYAYAGVELTDNARAEMRAFTDAHPLGSRAN